MSFSTNDNLDWNVVTRPLTVKMAECDGGMEVTVPNKVAKVRDDNWNVIGVTGTNYQTFQNSSLKKFVEPLVSEGLLEITNIGYLGVGGKVFIQATMSESFTVAGENHKGSITLLNSHDGTAALAAGVTDTRVICGNTFALAMGDMSTRLRHGKNLNDEASRITEVIDFVNKGMSDYTTAAEKLASCRVTEMKMSEIIEETFNKPKESIRAYNKIVNLVRNGRGNDGSTLYDVVNGITEYHTHFAGKDDKRFASANFGRNSILNRRAYNVALAMI